MYRENTVCEIKYTESAGVICHMIL